MATVKLELDKTTVGWNLVSNIGVRRGIELTMRDWLRQRFENYHARYAHSRNTRDLRHSHYCLYLMERVWPPLGRPFSKQDWAKLQRRKQA